MIRPRRASTANRREGLLLGSCPAISELVWLASAGICLLLHWFQRIERVGKDGVVECRVGVIGCPAARAERRRRLLTRSQLLPGRSERVSTGTSSRWLSNVYRSQVKALPLKRPVDSGRAERSVWARIRAATSSRLPGIASLAKFRLLSPALQRLDALDPLFLVPEGDQGDGTAGALGQRGTAGADRQDASKDQNGQQYSGSAHGNAPHSPSPAHE